jgi:hypothetical protein
MLAAVGCLVPEVLSLRGVELGEAVWWKVGAAKLNSDLAINWGGIEGFRIAGKQVCARPATRPPPACAAVAPTSPEKTSPGPLCPGPPAASACLGVARRGSGSSPLASWC